MGNQAMTTQLTKREQIAVAAMQAIIGSKEGAQSYPRIFAKVVAQASIEYANELLKALAQVTPEEEDTHGE